MAVVATYTGMLRLGSAWSCRSHISIADGTAQGVGATAAMIVVVADQMQWSLRRACIALCQSCCLFGVMGAHRFFTASSTPSPKY